MDSLSGEYIHSKTGNTYEYMDIVHATTEKPKNYTIKFFVHCCEDKGVLVQVYQQDGKYYYVTKDNPDLHENTKTKVLYERDSMVWLRSEDDFHKPITLNGVEVPRFRKVNP